MKLIGISDHVVEARQSPVEIVDEFRVAIGLLVEKYRATAEEGFNIVDMIRHETNDPLGELTMMSSFSAVPFERWRGRLGRHVRAS